MPREIAPELKIVVVGGHDLAAIREVVRGLPHPLGLAVVIATGEHDLAADIASATKIPITQLHGTARLEADRIYIVAGPREAVLRKGELVEAPPENGAGAPIDRLLRSVADSAGRDATGVILNGRGSDGALGIKRLKEAGGLAIVQQADGVTGEMPRAAIATGIVDLVLPAERIAAHLVSLAKADSDMEEVEARRPESVADTLRDILTLVRVRSGHDFAPYKRATLYRRIARRMQVCEAETISAYHQHLRDHPAELGHLLRDFLISVTNFFRDAQAFNALAQDVMPKLFAGKTSGDQVRVWVPGCATGEEAYSLGILLLEQAERIGSPPQIQIFATDIDDAALGEARAGLYPESLALDVPKARLQRFFTHENGHYRVSKELRELVLFSPHNVLRDPPFSRLDLISCRNLLIYLNREAQNRVLTMFHFGLRPDGFLFLGTSESADNSTMFATVDPKLRIFTRRAVPASLGEAITPGQRWHTPLPVAPQVFHDRTPTMSELHYQLVEQYAPPSALVNGELDVVHLSEHVGKFLQLAGGEPTRQLLRLAHPALRLDLRTAIYAARQQHTSDTRMVRFEADGMPRAIEIKVRALDIPELGPGALLVLFDEQNPGEQPNLPAAGTSIEPVVREIEDELHRTRDQLRTTIEQYETSLEELKASNEELQAINEELRSATEELETSKEELQSVNEELTTLNHELKVKVDEISHANSDLQNLMTSTDIGVVFLDRNLNIKRFTPRVQDLFNVIPSDIGRPLSHLTHRLEGNDLSEVGRSVLQTLRSAEREVKSIDGRKFLARWLPYRSLEDRIEGVVLTFIDVTDLRDALDARRRTEEALQVTEERLRVALRAAPVAVISFDAQLHVTWAHISGRELEGDERHQLAMFSRADGDRVVAAAKQVQLSRASQRLELDVTANGATRKFEFRVEPTASGVAAVGFDLSPARRPADPA